MGWLIALAVLILLGCLPLGISGIYDESGAIANLLVGPLRIALYPGKKKEKKDPEPEKQEKPVKSQKENEKQEKRKKAETLRIFCPWSKLPRIFWEISAENCGSSGWNCCFAWPVAIPVIWPSITVGHGQPWVT